MIAPQAALVPLATPMYKDHHKPTCHVYHVLPTFTYDDHEGACHYWHNALHQGSHSDRTSTTVPICVVHTQVDQVWSMAFTSSPPSPPPLSRPSAKNGAKVFYLTGFIHSQHPKVEVTA